MMKQRRNRAGMAVFIVVMVAAVIGVFVAIVFFHGRDTRRKGAEKRDKAQAQYLAKGAHNHFLLKFKLLPTELYDAVSYAVGKNPYFDFSIKVKSADAAGFVPADGVEADFGPMFFTGTAGKTKITKDGDDQLTIDRATEGTGLFQGAGMSGSAEENKHKMEYLLNHYILDIATGFPDANTGIVLVDSDEHDEVAQMGKSGNISDNGRVKWVDPFKGNYFVRSLRILGIGGSGAGSRGKKYQSDTVLLTTEATVRRDAQVSLVSSAGGGRKQLLIQREVNTSLKQENGGWLEVKEDLEDQASFDARSNGEGSATSARRTEISTGVYFVTRQTR